MAFAVLADDPVMSCICLFFFKQMTAYEMRISDWSSDVCSSDLKYLALVPVAARSRDQAQRDEPVGDGRDSGMTELQPLGDRPRRHFVAGLDLAQDEQLRRREAGRGGKLAARSAERRVGKGCVSTCRSRWSQYH